MYRQIRRATLGVAACALLAVMPGAALASGGGSTTTTSSAPCVNFSGITGQVIRYGSTDYLRFTANYKSCSSSTAYVDVRYTMVDFNSSITMTPIFGDSTLKAGQSVQNQFGGGQLVALPATYTVQADAFNFLTGEPIASYTAGVLVQPTNRVPLT